MAFRPGQTVYAAHPDEVEELTIVERGSGDFNLKRKVRDPYVVRGRDGSEWVYPGDILHADRLAAAAHSAQMMAELDEEGRRDNPRERLKVCIHGARSTRCVRPRSPRHRATLVRETATREGWAYATARHASGKRVVTDSIGGPPVGSEHLDLDVYEDERGGNPNNSSPWTRVFG